MALFFCIIKEIDLCVNKINEIRERERERESLLSSELMLIVYHELLASPTILY